MTKRVGATRRADVPAEVLAQLNAGTLATATLAEALCVDFAELLRTLDSTAPAPPTGGIAQRMQQVGATLHARHGLAGFERFCAHPSDTVRGWAAYLLATAELPLAERFTRIRPLADDPHFGVREWAWLALRPFVLRELSACLTLLTPWVHHPTPNLRRFAVEITRPRGVWCGHSQELQAHPERGLPLLDPLLNEPEKYVQDSVANWLNDASKRQPQWVRSVCQRWTQLSATPATRRICQRAQRSLE
jgi:3-methyladenine DNA glycosylase AlkC